MTSVQPEAGAVTIDEHTIDGRDGTVRVRDYRPTERTARTAFLWVHGGGFTSGGLDQKESDAPARQLAAAGTFVRTVDYRLAPRASLFREPNLAPQPGRFPAGFHDVIDAANSLVELEGAAINLGGGSAGANLAAAAALSIRDEGNVSRLRSLALGYGTFHAVLPPNPSIEGELRGVLAKWAFNPSMLRKMNLNYVGDPALLVPGYAFPGGANLTGLPPTLILDARNDRLRLSGNAFADELRAAGVEVHQDVVPGVHGFFNAPRTDRYAHGMRELSAWLAKHD